jgi:hypothetical protein
VAKSPDAITTVLPGIAVTQTRTSVNTHLLEQTLTRRPKAYRSQSLEIAVALVPPG